MPLVSLNTVNRWYKKDSWVYKNFTYLFKNPLWDKTVPSGFSLCPYFWLALFALTLFRVFVYAILGVRLLSKPFGSLLEKTDGFFRRAFNCQVDVPAVPTLVCTVLVGAFLGIVWVLFEGASIIYHSYAASETLSAIILPIGLLIVAIPCWMYYAETKDLQDRCRVEYYLRIATIFAVVAALYFQYDNFIEVAKFPFQLLWAMLVVVWDFIVQIPGWIWYGITVTCHAIYHALIGVIFIMLYSIGTIVGLTILGIFADKMYVASEGYQERKVEKQKVDTVECQAKHILNVFGRQCFEFDKMDRHESRSYHFWSRYLYSVPEAVGLAYEIARSGREVNDADFARARAAGHNTYNIQLQRDIAASKRRDQICNVISKGAEWLYHKIVIVAIPFRWFFRHLFSKTAWVAKEIWTFFCLLFSLIKSRKQGVCPYLRFEDASKKAK